MAASSDEAKAIEQQIKDVGDKVFTLWHYNLYTYIAVCILILFILNCLLYNYFIGLLQVRAAKAEKAPNVMELVLLYITHFILYYIIWYILNHVCKNKCHTV